MIIQEVNFRVSQLPVSEIHFVLRSIAALQRYIRTDSRLRQSFFKGHTPINRSFTISMRTGSSHLPAPQAICQFCIFFRISGIFQRTGTKRFRAI